MTNRTNYNINEILMMEKQYTLTYSVIMKGAKNAAIISNTV